MRAWSLLFALIPAAGFAFHDGPDPVASWSFEERNVKAGTFQATLGPAVTILGNPKPIKEVAGQSFVFDGEKDGLQLPEAANEWLPKRRLTAEAWVSVTKSYRNGGIVGVYRSSDDEKAGWLLGYNDRFFTFTLRGKDGKNPTAVVGKTQFEWGKMYQVVGTYDGTEMRLYVNGKLEGSSKAQTGDILYPAKAPISLGGLRNGTEFYPHGGRIREISIYDLTATPEGVQHLFEHEADLTKAPPVVAQDPEMKWIVEPYQQFPTLTSITISWETSRSATSVVRYGLDEKNLKEIKGTPGLLHHVKLPGLKADSHYVFQVETTDDQNRTLKSGTLTFRTAPSSDQPVRFTIVGDTQDQPQINKQIAERMWENRPDFFMIVGDLVGTGPDKSHWRDHFFGSMRPLLSRVPLMPVLGNHERDARFYYDYMDLPAPEYYYSFQYGPIEFFVVDSQRDVSPGSEQWKWLDKALAASKARWKFVAHHYPPFSSDEDDYGDRWKGQSEWGDLRIRELAKLYEKHGVDIVFTGHIHSYERTFPIKGTKVDERKGVIYVVCGGGGGHLETHAPTRPWFSNFVRRGHHYCQLSVTPERLEMRSYDIDGRLFDTMLLQKPKP